MFRKKMYEKKNYEELDQNVRGVKEENKKNYEELDLDLDLLSQVHGGFLSPSEAQVLLSLHQRGLLVEPISHEELMELHYASGRKFIYWE